MPMLVMLRRALPRLTAAALCGSSASLCIGAQAGGTHSDAEWYAQQNEHRLLGLSLVQEAKVGWWHEVVRRYRLGEGVDGADSDGQTLLHFACKAGKRRIVEDLLALGATPAPDRLGRTPLHSAAVAGHVSVAATLLDAGASDINEGDSSGATALHLAAQNGHSSFVRALIARQDLRPNQPDEYGVAALHKAVSFGHVNVVEALLADRRVDRDVAVGTPTAPDGHEALSGHETALQWARVVSNLSSLRLTSRCPRARRRHGHAQLPPSYHRRATAAPPPCRHRATTMPPPRHSLPFAPRFAPPRQASRLHTPTTSTTRGTRASPRCSSTQERARCGLEPPHAANSPVGPANSPLEAPAASTLAPSDPRTLPASLRPLCKRRPTPPPPPAPGADPNLRCGAGLTAAHRAARVANVGVLRELRHCTHTRWDMTDAEGLTPRDMAKHHGHSHVVELLDAARSSGPTRRSTGRRSG